MTDAAQTVYLADYQPFSHVVQKVDLTFRLAPKTTRVLARLALTPNPERPGPQDLRLDGEDLRLIRCTVNGAAISVRPDATFTYPMPSAS